MIKICPCPDCEWIYNPTPIPQEYHRPPDQPRQRAGVFIYHPETGKVLVIQVYNQYIGLPKGGVEPNETLEQAAIRETFEETGFRLDPSVLAQASTLKVHRSCTYFVLASSVCPPVELKTDQEVTGIGWVHLQCLPKLPGQLTSHLLQMVRRVCLLDLAPEPDPQVRKFQRIGRSPAGNTYRPRLPEKSVPLKVPEKFDL